MKRNSIKLNVFHFHCWLWPFWNLNLYLYKSMSQWYKHHYMRITVLLFCHLKRFLNLYSESFGTELYSLVPLLFCLFLAVACWQIHWPTGCLYMAKQEVPARASQRWWIGHILFISGETPALLLPPARLTWCSCVLLGSSPFPQVAWSWHHGSFPHSRTALGGDHANRKQLECGCRSQLLVWMAMPRGMRWFGCPEVSAQVGCRQPQIHALLRGSGLRFIISCWHLLAAPRTISEGPERVIGSKLRAPRSVSSFWESRRMGELSAGCGVRLAMLGPLNAIPSLCLRMETLMGCPALERVHGQCIHPSIHPSAAPCLQPFHSRYQECKQRAQGQRAS